MAEQPERPQPGSQLAEAEAMLDSLVARARDFTWRTVALAREEAEDIWAEAQQRRRGERGEPK